MAELPEKQQERGIIFDTTAFGHFLDQYEQMISLLMTRLTEGIDYGLPFPQAKKKVLLLSGAQKLAAFFGLNVALESKNYIYKNEEIWGVEVKLKVYRENRTIEVIASASYDEKAFETRPLHHLLSIAYKRAFVKGVIIYLGLSSSFLEEAEAEVEVEEVEVKPGINENMIKKVYETASLVGISKEMVDQMVKKKFNKQISELTVDEYNSLLKSIQKRKEENKKPESLW
ncbi:MAG: hypothetical protein QXI58_00550 [Candidatus Micrarchaeia archaeon]